MERFVAEQVAANRDAEPVGSDRRLWTYGESEPDRDHFTVWVRYVLPGRFDLELAARHWPIELQRRYVALYARPDEPLPGRHTLWCYEPPAGMRIETSEPDGWNGWRS